MRYTSACCIGTYPKWIARLIRWGIKRNPSCTVEITFRGRGKAFRGVDRKKTYPYGLPVSKASRIAVYVAVKKSMRFPDPNGGLIMRGLKIEA